MSTRSGKQYNSTVVASKKDKKQPVQTAPPGDANVFIYEFTFSPHDSITNTEFDMHSRHLMRSIEMLRQTRPIHDCELKTKSLRFVSNLKKELIELWLNKIIYLKLSNEERNRRIRIIHTKIVEYIATCPPDQIELMHEYKKRAEKLAFDYGVLDVFK